VNSNKVLGHIFIQDSWTDLLDKIEFFAEDKGGFSHFAGPGGWNDPDMVIF